MMGRELSRMNRNSGLRMLGLPERASERDIERTYRSRVLPVKQHILGARRAVDVTHHRDELRRLVAARDAAIGREPRSDWRGEHLGVSATRLLDLLDRTNVSSLDRRVACAFFKLPAGATRKDVIAAYAARKRALIRQFANAREDEELSAIRRARSKLRTIRNFALA
jgi:hypothetical protein